MSRWVHPLLKKVAFASQPTLQKHGRWRVGRQLLTSIWDAWVKKNEALDREPTASELRRMLERVMGLPEGGVSNDAGLLAEFRSRFHLPSLLPPDTSLLVGGFDSPQLLWVDIAQR